MNFCETPYFCNQCKKSLTTMSELLFVEDGSSRGFCSETCIEAYFHPIVAHYEEIEDELRKEFKIAKEDCFKYAGESKYIESVLCAPSEIWHFENEIKEDLFAFILKTEDDKGKDFYLLSLCHVFNFQPAFVLLLTATRSEAFVDKFRIGAQVPDVTPFLSAPSIDDEETPVTDSISPLDDNTVMLLEGKKSEILGDLLSKRSPADIAFENFSLYKSFIGSTVAAADEVWRYYDDANDEIYIHIKVHEKDGVAFYYFVLCLFKSQLLPFLSFPSLDPQVYHDFRRGEFVSGKLKN